MFSLPGYNRWITTPPEDRYDGPIFPICEVELDKDNTCACGEYCIDCCPDCETKLIVEIILPAWLQADLMACFKLKESDKYPGFFPIWNDTTNNWLMKSLGIFTDDEAIFTKLNDAFTVVFDWHIQRFCVGAGEPL